MSKNYEWTVVITCQGHLRYYHQRNLLFGIVALVYYYCKYNKYGTMNFALKQRFK